ncbi:MAG TPA: glutamyl-tRNA reductase [Woeseiaceae bacterium]|nr:glutamyl-tRNA reductase [Woeseiaceae bacterium]
MTLKILGLNHHTASLHYREQLIFTDDQIKYALQELTAIDTVKEAVILSTCNRTEFYLSTNRIGLNHAITWLTEFKQIDEHTEELLFTLEKDSALLHLSRVACGLDSMILGEPQILGQLKEAFRFAQTQGTIKKYFTQLFNHVFYAAKKIRTNTKIGKGPVSVSYAAVTLANQFFSKLENQTALLIGAGTSIELVAKHLSNKNIDKLFIANRSFDKAQELAKKYNGYAIELSNLKGVLEITDMIFSSTSSENFILRKNQITEASLKRKRKPIFAVDMAVPRDLDPNIQEIEDIYLYTIDDLEKVVLEGTNNRKIAAIQANEILIEETTNFLNKIKGEKAETTIIKLREYAESLRKEVLIQSEKQMKKGVSVDDIIEQSTVSLIKKILHRPSKKIKEAGENSDEEFIKNISKLFDLDER